MGAVVPFPLSRIPLRVEGTPLGASPEPARRGDVYIWPSPEDGGCWGVEHLSASGNSSALLATAFSFDEAVTIARSEARRLGATFDDPSSTFGGAA